MILSAFLEGRCWRGCESTGLPIKVDFVGPAGVYGQHLPLFLCQGHQQRLLEWGRDGVGSSACWLCETVGVAVDLVGENYPVLTAVSRWSDGRSVCAQWTRRDRLYGCAPCRRVLQQAAEGAYQRQDVGRRRADGIAASPPPHGGLTAAPPRRRCLSAFPFDWRP
ncbi:hypothetical protein [Streptomyces sp. NPDC059788]|uniref:hypothetical protein n=1 Tax=Streptomyces sp. NPDC059788 TaxID=3346948 RepID=UPI00364D725D